MDKEEHRKKWIEAEYATLGWRCPVCGRGLAPDVKECHCVIKDWNCPTCGTGANQILELRTTPPEA